MILSKLYLYDSAKESEGYRGTDLSAYLLQGDTYEEDLSQELDSGNITLDGYPYRKEFAPETKFILDKVLIVETQDGEKVEDKIYTYHICVEKDIVAQPIMSDNEYFTHTIFFIEPSVVAQKRVVDNISATYKLSDVSLEQDLAYDINATNELIFTPSKYTPNSSFGWDVGKKPYALSYHTRFGRYLEWEGNIEISTKNNSYKYYNLAEGNEIRFVLPKLAVYKGKENSTEFEKIGYASTKWEIEQYSIFDLNTVEKTWTGKCASHSDFSNYQWEWEDTPFHPKTATAKRVIFDNMKRRTAYGNTTYDYYYSQLSEEGLDGTVDFTTDIITVEKDKIYIVKVSLFEYNERLDFDFDIGANASAYPSRITKVYAETYSYGAGTTYTYTPFADEELTAQNQVQTFKGDTGEVVVLASANPYSALSLLTKAVINSGTYRKKKGVCAFNLNARDNDGKLITPYPFYIDENFVDELRNTQVIENFYQQKNLWEIATEVGYYIHAVPNIVFGEDDRFMFTFHRLGETEQKENLATRTTITNFKGVEDYVSSCSSYVSNLVQLGGTIDEWVMPKSTDEDYLVYNDVAKIIVSKPIIEIVKLEAKVIKSGGITISGETALENTIVDITKYVFENNVYALLDVNTSVFPNKGVAINYTLGENIIEGLTYRSPTANSGDKLNDYAIKKILYTAFFNENTYNPNKNSWATIRINDFAFRIVYRTKDEARLTHSRPDLRKYLVSSKYDIFPQHFQYNNQQDTLIDSNKFGSNIYGKLLRTGNTNFTIQEWTDDLQKIKHKGELYNIDGDLFYVAKAKHTFYSNEILSEITYSKDYNQLSQVIGIPSEPRFYEISEQSMIQREFSINDYVLLCTTSTKLDYAPQNDPQDFSCLKTLDHLINLMFGGIADWAGTDFARYVQLSFKGDKDNDQLASVVAGETNFVKNIILPLNAFSSHTTLTYSWDARDNFSIADKVGSVETDLYDETKDYRTLIPVRYTDTYGKASLMDFYLLESIPITNDAIKEFPDTAFTSRDMNSLAFPVVASNVSPMIYGNFDANGEFVEYNQHGLVIEKDCREALNGNYNLQLLTDSDTFVISPFVFSPNKSGSENVPLQCCLVALNKEVNKLTNGFIKSSDIIQLRDADGNNINSIIPLAYGYPNIDRLVDEFSWVIHIDELLARANEKHWQENTENYVRIKALVILMDIPKKDGVDLSDINFSCKFVIAKNIQDVETKEDVGQWYIGVPQPSALFREKQ